MLAFLLMFDIMALLLYYNLFAQAPDGLGQDGGAAGLSLMPLSVALFGFARRRPSCGCGRHATVMPAGGLLLLAWLRRSPGFRVAWPARGSMAEAVFSSRRRHRVALCVATEDRPRGAAGRRCPAKGSGILNSSSFLAAPSASLPAELVFGVAGLKWALALVALSVARWAVLSLQLKDE